MLSIGKIDKIDILSSNKVKVNVKMMCVFGSSFRIDDPYQPLNSLMSKYNYLRFKLNISTIYVLQMFCKTLAIL